MARTVGVVLAGGASSRMGRPKALLRDDRGRTFLESVVRALRGGGCDAVVVVGGCHVGEIAGALPEGALLVHNPDWEQGQLSSARLGLCSALLFQPARLVLHVVDQPLLQAADVRRVLAGLARQDLAVACHQGETGHPIALSAAAAARVVSVRGATLREVLEQAAPRRREVSGCSAGCVRGANTPAELRALVRGR